MEAAIFHYRSIIRLLAAAVILVIAAGAHAAPSRNTGPPRGWDGGGPGIACRPGQCGETASDKGGLLRLFDFDGDAAFRELLPDSRQWSRLGNLPGPDLDVSALPLLEILLLLDDGPPRRAQVFPLLYRLEESSLNFLELGSGDWIDAPPGMSASNRSGTGSPIGWERGNHYGWNKAWWNAGRRGRNRADVMPEPGSLTLFAGGLLGLALFVRRRQAH